MGQRFPLGIHSRRRDDGMHALDRIGDYAMSTPEELEWEASFEAALEGLAAREQEAEEFYAWLEKGLERKWVSGPVCATHEGLPTRRWEDAEFEEGYDPCIVGMRVWHGVQPDEPAQTDNLWLTDIEGRPE